jgi:hypothetical protein
MYSTGEMAGGRRAARSASSFSATAVWSKPALI